MAAPRRRVALRRDVQQLRRNGLFTPESTEDVRRLLARRVAAEQVADRVVGPGVEIAPDGDRRPEPVAMVEQQVRRALAAGRPPAEAPSLTVLRDPKALTDRAADVVDEPGRGLRAARHVEALGAAWRGDRDGRQHDDERFAAPDRIAADARWSISNWSSIACGLPG
ncbi:hypothetical protein [Mariniluteicoccus flavus]